MLCFPQRRRRRHRTQVCKSHYMDSYDSSRLTHAPDLGLNESSESLQSLAVCTQLSESSIWMGSQPSSVPFSIYFSLHFMRHPFSGCIYSRFIQVQTASFNFFYFLPEVHKISSCFFFVQVNVGFSFLASSSSSSLMMLRLVDTSIASSHLSIIFLTEILSSLVPTSQSSLCSWWWSRRDWVCGVYLPNCRQVKS